MKDHRYITFPHFIQKLNESHVIDDVYLQDCQVCFSLDHYSQKTRDFCTPRFNRTCSLLRNKKLWKNLIFVGMGRRTGRLRLEMTSYSDNGYDVTNYFVFFFKVLSLYSVPTRFH